MRSLEKSLRGRVFARLIAISIVCVASINAFAKEDVCAIASAHPLATKAGCEILARGGNAFDAAVAVTAALAVVEPYSSGLGGGGFYLLHRAADSFEVFIDAREVAPIKVSVDQYVDKNGVAISSRSRSGATSAGIPGIPAAIQRLSDVYGQLPLDETLAPAIMLAEEGFAADSRYVRVSGWMAQKLGQFPRTSAIFLDDGKPVDAGFVVRQADLANTLRRFANEGANVFYHGDMAQEMVRSVRSNGGHWILDDLANYRVVEREPRRFRFHGAQITTAPLPSSGGLVMAQTLQIVDTFPMRSMAQDARVHTIVEAMRRAYNDRARFMGDADFVKVPAEKLASSAYARERAKGIDPVHATPSSDLPGVDDPAEEGEDTTHFSIIDAEGNRVAATLSINWPFGAGLIAGNTGVLLNNHMDDFAITQASPNLYKLVGNAANAIAPGKRPLSSMSPTFVEDDRGVLVLGTPGGSRIISMVMLGVIDYLLNDEADAERVVALPRYHHQYLPDRIQVEPGGYDEEWIESLRAKGHEVEVYRRKWGNMQAVFFDARTGKRHVANDPRGRAGVVF